MEYPIQYSSKEETPIIELEPGFWYRAKETVFWEFGKTYFRKGFCYLAVKTHNSAGQPEVTLVNDNNATHYNPNLKNFEKV